MARTSVARRTTLILVCLKQAPASFIQLHPGLGHDIYLIFSYRLFLRYVAELVDRIQSDPDHVYENLCIILVNEDFSVLLQALTLLQKKGPLTAKTRERFMLLYKRSLTSAYAQKDLDFEVKLPAGLVDLPVTCETYILQSCEGYSHLEHLSEKHVWTQQMLRFVALKHGALFAAVSGLSSALSSLSAVFDFADRLRLANSVQGALNYKVAGTAIVEEAVLHQFISVGEDTWGKVVLLAKSIPQVKKMERVLTTELQLQELNDLYSELFEKVSSGQETVAAETRLLQSLGLAPVEDVKQPAPLFTFRNLLDSSND